MCSISLRRRLALVLLVAFVTTAVAPNPLKKAAQKAGLKASKKKGVTGKVLAWNRMTKFYDGLRSIPVLGQVAATAIPGGPLWETLACVNAINAMTEVSMGIGGLNDKLALNVDAKKYLKSAGGHMLRGSRGTPSSTSS